MKKWKYTVVSVNTHPEENGWGLVSIRPIFDTEEAAMEDAKRQAVILMNSTDEYQGILDKIKFEDVWTRVDNGKAGASKELGYDPKPNVPPPSRWHRFRVVSTFEKGGSE